MISGFLTPEEFLGEWRAVVRKMVLLAHERNGRLRIELPELFGGLIGREPTADQEIRSAFHHITSAMKYCLKDTPRLE